MTFYLDSSAFLKLVVDEPEAPAMRGWFGGADRCHSSVLLLTEAHRAARRMGLEPARVEEPLQHLNLTLPDAGTFQAAAQLTPASLRSLDALHLASALELGADLEALVSYDRRLLDAAVVNDIAVLTPGG